MPLLDWKSVELKEKPTLPTDGTLIHSTALASFRFIHPEDRRGKRQHVQPTADASQSLESANGSSVKAGVTKEPGAADTGREEEAVSITPSVQEKKRPRKAARSCIITCAFSVVFLCSPDRQTASSSAVHLLSIPHWGS